MYQLSVFDKIKKLVYNNTLKMSYAKNVHTFKYHRKSSPSGLSSVTFSKFALICSAIFYKHRIKIYTNNLQHLMISFNNILTTILLC